MGLTAAVVGAVALVFAASEAFTLSVKAGPLQVELRHSSRRTDRASVSARVDEAVNEALAAGRDVGRVGESVVVNLLPAYDVEALTRLLGVRPVIGAEVPLPVPGPGQLELPEPAPPRVDKEAILLAYQQARSSRHRVRVTVWVYACFCSLMAGLFLTMVQLAIVADLGTVWVGAFLALAVVLFGVMVIVGRLAVRKTPYQEHAAFYWQLLAEAGVTGEQANEAMRQAETLSLR
ncbi:hypothetical protein SAMN06893096_103473 [Geodermatophilus pulveris]|uniref:Uncharacterized protein n=1 Tax=Geodermatophilus pulveris TaxID=1564159 RepID=A0A239E257_9ACTN|nr:hypothetical protein SAMN06893096_103473 [Geodermatophilus pulveris]